MVLEDDPDDKTSVIKAQEVQYSVTLVYNPRSVVIDQGADPLSAPCLFILQYMVCALVCTYVRRDDESANCNTKLLSGRLSIR